MSRRGDRLKVLTWQAGGFVLTYKRLERGRFRLPKLADDVLGAQLDATQLALLLDGVDLSHVRRPSKWSPPAPAAGASHGVLLNEQRWQVSPKTTRAPGARKPRSSRASSETCAVSSGQLQRHVYGRRSEKVPTAQEELRQERPAPDPDAVKKKRAAGREERARAAESEVVEHRVPEEMRRCPACGGRALEPLGEGKRTVVYEYVPARLVQQVHVQETLVCRCGAGVVTAPGAPKAMEKGHFGPGLIAHVVTAKVADSIPVYRQAKGLQRSGIGVSRNTLGDLLHAAARSLEPLSARLLALIAQEDVVHADETPMRVLAEGKTRRAYLWNFRTEKLVAFRFSPGRSGETPRNVLGGTRGYIVVDGYTAYNAVTVPEGRVRAACWAHTRRRFYEARTTAPTEADEVLALIRTLYRVEQEAKEAGVVGTPLHLELRRRKSAPVLAAIDAWLAAHAPRHPPKSPLGEAIRYARGQWQALCRFLEDARLPLDNNAAERALRPAALGRKNYLFVGNDEAGERLAGLYALVATCEANGVDPERYLADVLVRIGSTPARRIDSLLPHRWQPNTS